MKVPTKERLLPSVIPKQRPSLRHLPKTPSKASGIEQSWQPISSTVSVRPNWPISLQETSKTAKVSPTYECSGSVQKFAMSPSTPPRKGSSKNTWNKLATGKNEAVPSSGLSATTGMRIILVPFPSHRSTGTSSKNGPSWLDWM